MTVDSMNEIVENIRSIYTIVMGLAIAEAFNQAVRELKPIEEKHAKHFRNWFDCVHANRLVSLSVFLLLAVPFFQGNQRYLYLQYIAPLHTGSPPRSISAFWLNLDCLTFSLEAGIFFVLSRSLSARRWQQFYGTVIVLMLVDFFWAATELHRGTRVPAQWMWFDLGAVVILGAVIFIDWFFVPYKEGKELNKYCFAIVSIIALAGLTYGYFTQLDYLIE
jgi:hypothetical protein